MQAACNTRRRCGRRSFRRHCERSEAIQDLSAEAVWIASSQVLLAMTSLEQALSTLSTVIARLDRAIQYSETSIVYGEAAEYWIARPSAQLRTRREMTPNATRRCASIPPRTRQLLRMVIGVAE